MYLSNAFFFIGVLFFLFIFIFILISLFAHFIFFLTLLRTNYYRRTSFRRKNYYDRQCFYCASLSIHSKSVKLFTNMKLFYRLYYLFYLFSLGKNPRFLNLCCTNLNNIKQKCPAYLFST